MLNYVINAGLSVDGNLGSKTEAAIKTYQMNEGLTVDGICGSTTRSSLESDYQVIQSPLKNGSSGNAVRVMQSMLNSVINAGLSIDGVFGSSTEAAVKEYQTNEGLKVDGVCGTTTWTALKLDYKVITLFLKNGSYGAAVKRLQTMLNAVTNFGLKEDGSFGASTETALRRYQANERLNDDGVCGPTTWSALKIDYAVISSPLKNGSFGSAVRTMQTMLNKVTDSSLSVDGNMGISTEAVLKKYQSYKGLKADGICGTNTWASLKKDYIEGIILPVPVEVTLPSSVHTLTHVSAKASTHESEGNIEYWYCGDCGRYFSDAAATTEITQSDTVVAKLDSPADPETPDASAVHFQRVNVYFQGQFTDVAANQWFTSSVAGAFELGLMKGDSGTTFSPYGDVTIAQAITMAARIHSIYTTGTENFVQTGKWYQVYLDYAYENGIISYAYYNCDVNHKATRAQFAEIFAKAMPEEGLYAINNVADNAVPDVKMSASYVGSVYKLYRAGILTGSDANGTFSPDTYITRAEASAIVSRMAESSDRVSFSLR